MKMKKIIALLALLIIIVGISHASIPTTADGTSQQESIIYKNILRERFQNKNAIIYSLVMRTFNAQDLDGNEIIDPSKGETIGTFSNAIERLDELQELGINTLHILPVYPTGKTFSLGNAGSVYAPADFLSIDDKLDDPTTPGTAFQEAQQFIRECHRRNISVMFDLPCCGSVEFFENNPSLLAVDAKGNAIVPHDWVDIRIFKLYEDKKQTTLNEELYKMHQDYIDMLLNLGVDGLRVDVAKSKPLPLWERLIKYTRDKDPNFEFLAESYRYEDTTGTLNIAPDRPKRLLQAGFDSYYSNFQDLYKFDSAQEFHKLIQDNTTTLADFKQPRSLIGAFHTHDTKSPMFLGGVDYCKLLVGLQTTLPDVNPFFVAGFESGDTYDYSFKNKKATFSDNDSKEYFLHPYRLDIFNYSRKPGGDHPEIAEFIKSMLKTRSDHYDTIVKGSYEPIPTDTPSSKILSYARKHENETLLVISNIDRQNRLSTNLLIPGITADSTLKNISQQLKEEDTINIKEPGKIFVDLAPSSFYLFSIPKE